MGVLTKAFFNRTGQVATDLHVIFSARVTRVRPSPPPPFSRTWGLRTNVIHFDGHVVASRKRVGPITFTGPQDLEVLDWWWTKDGRQLGRAHPRRKVRRKRRLYPGQLPLFPEGHRGR